jgi:dihydroflavonol-4-reductase
MNILITGATGLLGTEICRQLTKDNENEVRCLVRKRSDALPKNVIQIKGDIRDITSLYKALEGIDVVIHAAAMVSFNIKDKAELFETNVDGTTNLVNACDLSKIKKFIHVSSVAAIGKPSNGMDSENTINVNESYKWQDSPLNSLYGQSKYLAELEVWRGHAEGLNTVIVNPSIILGEGEWERSSTQLFNYVNKGNRFYTNGYINYIDVKDVAKSILHLMKSDIVGERYILNTGKISFKGFFEKVANSLDKKAPDILLNKIMIEILWRLEWLRSLVSGSNPLITRETSITARSNVYFDNSKIKEVIPFELERLEITIDRVSEYLKKKQ